MLTQACGHTSATPRAPRASSAATARVLHRATQRCDLNDYPESGALDPLLRGTNLRDAMALQQYRGAFPGTYQRATSKEKIDYLLLSPALRKRVQTVDVCRNGFYVPRKWESFENITGANKDRFQASDHHCLWADIEI